LKLLDILLNLIVLMLKALKLGPNLVFNILWIKQLLEFPLELMPCVDGIRFSLDVITPTMHQTRVISLREKAAFLTF